MLVLREQRLTPGQQVDFTRRFGTLEVHVRKESRLEGFHEMLIVSNIVDGLGNPIGVQDAGRFWHSDLSYKAEPSLLSALYAVEVPMLDGKALGDTEFASTAAAYEALPEETRQRIARLKCVHSYRFYREQNAAAARDDAARGGRSVSMHLPTGEQLKSVPDVASPVVRTHPVTGRRSLFVNEAHCPNIVGLERAESDALLASLCAHIVRPEFVYRHSWRPGDLLMWDNCAVQHKANFDYDLPLRRLMYRTTVRGTSPF